MEEKDISRLDYLADAIVAAPGMMMDFTQTMLNHGGSPELLTAVQAVRTVFQAEPGGAPTGPIGLDRLRGIARKLRAMPTHPAQCAGYALEHAIKHVAPRTDVRRALDT